MGGNCYITTPTTPYLNDLWKFNTETKTWTWVSGADTPNALGVYGAQGVAAADNMPGARYQAVGWTDSGGDLWLFGGSYQSADRTISIYFNDLWRYQS